jgi:hypothetical protein
VQSQLILLLLRTFGVLLALINLVEEHWPAWIRFGVRANLVGLDALGDERKVNVGLAHLPR